MLKRYRNKKVLITGGLGMIGSNIAKRLVDLGAVVTIADARIHPYGANDFNVKKIRNRVKIVKADIRNRDDMTPLIKDCEIIFNLAGQVSHNDSIENPFLDTDINYLGHLNILEIIKRINPRIKILYSGSRLQYGKVESIPVREDHPQRPLSPYALNKFSAENLYLFYHRLYEIPVVIFRITNPFGPGGQVKHNKYNIVNWFIRLALENRKISIFGEGKQIRDYIFVDDLTDAFIKAGISDRISEEVFNLGSGHGVSFLEMARKVVEYAGSGSIVNIPWPDNYINVETGDFIADIEKLKSAIPWSPVTSIDEGLKITCEYYRKNIRHYL